MPTAKPYSGQEDASSYRGDAITIRWGLSEAAPILINPRAVNSGIILFQNLTLNVLVQFSLESHSSFRSNKYLNLGTIRTGGG